MAGLVSATRTARYLPRHAEIIRCNIDPIKSQVLRGGVDREVCPLPDLARQTSRQPTRNVVSSAYPILQSFNLLP